MANKKDITATSTESIREAFVKRMKEALPKNISLVDELSALLDISNDSAYRRIRGETAFTLDEIYKICRTHNISMDDVFSSRADTVTFTYTKLTESADNFQSYFDRLLNHLNAINSAATRKISYVAGEMPLFYSFYSKRLAAFKLYYWQRSVLNVADFQTAPFHWEIVPENLINVAHNSFKQYMNIPSTEVWTTETVLTGLKQIKFYFESGILKKEDALVLLEDYRQMIVMVQQNAAIGMKSSSDTGQTFELYHSEVVLGTNCIYVEIGSNKYSYITFNTFNSLTTANPEFCEETEHWIKSLERKSVLISGAAEKLRNRFFAAMFKQIDAHLEDIKNDRLS